MTRGLLPWLPLIIAILGIGGTLLASWLAYRNALRVERARWERDDRIRQEQIERETRDRYNLERIRTYTEFLYFGGVISVGFSPELADSAEQYKASLMDYHRAYYATRILATPPVRAAAEALYDLVMQDDQENSGDFGVRRIDARDAFVEAAQTELGVPMDAQ